MEAKFKQWLQRCHATLDKSVRFEALSNARVQVRGTCCQPLLQLLRSVRLAAIPASHVPLQAAARSKHGEEVTAFERVTDGARTVSTGDVVRINAKPQAVGRVLHFTIPQAVREEGAYANGRVHVQLLPEELYGAGCEKQFSLRRLEAVLSEAEQAEHLQREMLKVCGRPGPVLRSVWAGSSCALRCCRPPAASSPHPGACHAAHRADAVHHGADAGV